MGIFRGRLHLVIVGLLLICFVVLRFWDIEGRMQFTWDQVKNAWVMKDMLVDYKMPLEGMEAKLNSGVKIGPAYYYLLAPFYAAFALDPMAAGVFAGVVAVCSAIVFFVLLQKLFSFQVALAGLAIYTFSFRIIQADRIAWPVIFLPVLSVIIFYYLQQVIGGKVRELPKLALALGFSLHIHFTALFYFFYTLLVLPFVVKKKEFGRWVLLSLPLFLVWLIPMLIVGAGQNFSSGANFVSYIQTYYHGLHATRVLQVLPDALIEFQSVIGVDSLKFLKYLILPVFLIVYAKKHRSKAGVWFCFLTAVWFAVPLLLFSVYRGEISDYYFAVTRPIVIMIYAYLTVELLRMKRMWMSALVIVFWLTVLGINMQNFIRYTDPILGKNRMEVRQKIETGEPLGFTEGDPKSYLYYLYTKDTK